MKNRIIIAQTPTVPDFTQDVISATEQGYDFGITVMIAATAAFLAVSLVAFLLHRSTS